MNNLYVALIHFPVVNKQDKEVGSALTTIDLHDIARAGQTFGVKAFYVVTPFEDQVELAGQVIEHWINGVGGQVNPARKQALELIRVTQTFEQALESIREETKKDVTTVATSAKDSGQCITTAQLRTALKKDTPHLLAFGTAWGLTEEFIDACDVRLGPINGPGTYNHLSVRSAASIYLDRITRANQEEI